MKRAYLFLILAMAAGLTRGTVLTYTDDFNDGVRDKTFWAVDNDSGGGFVEMNGHLNGYSGPDIQPTGYYGISWKMKAIQLVVKGDILEVEAKFHFPKQMLPDQNLIGMEIGFMAVSNEYMWAKANVFNVYKSGVFLEIQKASREALHKEVFIPDRTTFWLKIRYDSETGKVGLWCRPTAADKWTLASTVKMNAYWGVPVGKLLFLRPYVRFVTRVVRVESPGPYFIDNFTTRLIAP